MTRLFLFELFVTNLLLFEHQPKSARFLVSFELFVTNLRLFEHQLKLLVSSKFSGPYDVAKCGSG